MIQSAKPKVSLIIACYNQANELEKVMCSLKNQTLKDFEIIIADDGSGVEVARVVDAYSQHFRYPVQHVWQEDLGNRKPRIVNLAVKKSKSDLLVFIDADCLLHHRFLSSHYKWRKTGIVLTGRRISFDESTSRQLNLNQIEKGLFEKPAFWWNHSKPNERMKGFYLPFLTLFSIYRKKKYWILGSNFSLHKSDFIAINGYDEEISGYGFEDTNLELRLIMYGCKIKSLTHEALQYHLYHPYSVVNRSQEEISKITSPKMYYAAKGLN